MTQTTIRTIRSPQIRLSISLDGKISDCHVVADTPEDRDRALAKLRRFLPSIELLESLAHDEPPQGDPDGRGSSNGNTAVVG